MTIQEFIERLQELPSEWIVSGTKAGGSVAVDAPGDSWITGHRYGFVFTDGRPTMLLTVRGGS